jgi:hypothetical protein
VLSASSPSVSTSLRQRAITSSMACLQAAAARSCFEVKWL